MREKKKLLNHRISINKHRRNDGNIKLAFGKNTH